MPSVCHGDSRKQLVISSYCALVSRTCTARLVATQRLSVEGEMVSVGDAETGGYTETMEGEMVSVGDAETGGYRDLWREKLCQWVTPRLVAYGDYQ